MLVRNTTWTASRDGTEGATFLHPTFYDGQAMMVAADSGFESIDDMDGTTICVAAGTTTEGNVATEFARRGLTADVQSFDEHRPAPGGVHRRAVRRLVERQQPARALRSAYPDGPDALVIFDDIFSKEPLTPAVVDGDTAGRRPSNGRSSPRSRPRSTA